jgi:fructose-1-phosphate kinase PfkB-like protein
VPQDAYKDLILHCEEAKVPVFIDASGPALTAALEARPMVVKFNHRFLLSTLGYPMGSLDDILNFVSKIHDNGIEWSVTTYGTVGNIFYTPQGIYLVDIGREEKEQMVSLLAIDDALMAGLAVALLEEMDVELAVRFAQACALEDTLHVRKGIRGRSMVESLVPKIMVEKLT